MSESAVDTKKLDALIKALKESKARGRIGILGPSVRSVDGKAVNNAVIGAAHEFGTSKLPQRSFLRMPLADRLPQEVLKAGLLDKDVVTEVIKTKSVVPWLKKIMVLANSVVLEAFDTGGFGKWQPSNMKNKKNAQTLVETGQLRDSITTEVKE